MPKQAPRAVPFKVGQVVRYVGEQGEWIVKVTWKGRRSIRGRRTPVFDGIRMSDNQEVWGYDGGAPMPGEPVRGGYVAEVLETDEVGRWVKYP